MALGAQDSGMNLAKLQQPADPLTQRECLAPLRVQVTPRLDPSLAPQRGQIVGIAWEVFRYCANDLPSSSSELLL